MKYSGRFTSDTNQLLYCTKYNNNNNHNRQTIHICKYYASVNRMYNIIQFARQQYHSGRRWSETPSDAVSVGWISVQCWSAKSHCLGRPWTSRTPGSAHSTNIREPFTRAFQHRFLQCNEKGGMILSIRLRGLYHMYVTNVGWTKICAPIKRCNMQKWTSAVLNLHMWYVWRL